MMNSLRDPVVYIYGVPFFVGLVMVLISSVFYQQDARVPWDDIVLAVGAALVAAIVGRAAIDVRHNTRRVTYAIILVLVIAFLTSVYLFQGFRTEILTLLSIFLTVVIAEVVLFRILNWSSSP